MINSFLFPPYRDCRVVRDPHTFKSKGYGFVSFIKKAVSTLEFEGPEEDPYFNEWFDS